MYLKYLIQNKYKYQIYTGMIDGIETVKIKIFYKHKIHETEFLQQTQMFQSIYF